MKLKEKGEVLDFENYGSQRLETIVFSINLDFGEKTFSMPKLSNVPPIINQCQSRY